MTPQRMKFLPWLLCSLLVGVGLAVALPASGAQSTDSAAATHRTPPAEVPASDCMGGEEWPFEISPIIDAAERTARGERLKYHLEIQNKVEAPMRLTYAWGLSDDRGQELARYRAPAPAAVAAKGLHWSRDLQLADLPDGFYRVTFTVAAVVDHRESVAKTDWWLEVRGGQFRELTRDEWNQRSRSNLPTQMEGVKP